MGSGGVYAEGIENCSSISKTKCSFSDGSYLSLVGLETSSYDNLNRLTRKDIALGTGVVGVTWETYEYDGLGRLVDGNDSNGNQINFVYDANGNLISETNGEKTINYEYDLNSNLTEILA